MEQLQGQDLKRAFSAATGCLEEYRDVVNALNVFPVPDGDTGTNMLLTMRSAVQAANQECPDGLDHSVATVSAALAQGAFFGARGNSGVILSQFFKGFSDALAGKETLAADDLPLAFKLAADAAYKSVGNPVEGTMLTVIRMASEAVQEKPGAQSIISLWETAYQASQDALERTPQQLPVLREAGVVDSGGMGIVVLIGGAFRYLSDGYSTDGNSTSASLPGLSRFQGTPEGTLAGKLLGRDGLVKREYLESTLEREWGNCTQFIISGSDLDPDAVRSHFQETALSTVVIGDDRNIRVHIHVDDTGPALSYAGSLGDLSDIKIENMDGQNQTFASGHETVQTKAPALALALVSVTSGDGLASLFRESGCAAIIEGGQTINLSIGQVIEAARNTGAKDVIVLPNNGNVVMAAEQAAAMESFIHVVPSKSVPQGVAALLAFSPEVPWPDNFDAMTAALSEVTSLEVTTAVRGVKMDGVEVVEGDHIGLMEGRLITIGDSPEIALRLALDQGGLGPDAIVTLYRGADAQASDAETVAQGLRDEFPGIQVDVIDGGQPHYQYLASIE
ncbi:MAG: DAK2 domain-containing protein [Chloroflexi bacterium]|nr:DAK2 domain-containing protein [Chloroflexota bacterium]